MTLNPIASRPLANGLHLVLADHSRRIAGDRWYVCVTMEIKIPVAKKWFANEGIEAAAFDRIADELGPEIVFRQKKERNFVSDDQKAKIVAEICDSAMALGIQYCSSDAFAAKFILKTFGERPRRRN